MIKTQNVIEVTDETFAREVIERSRETTVLVDFWAPWCGPCHMLGPILERLATAPDSNFVLAKVNVDHHQRYVGQFGVQGIPAVKAFRDGRLVGGFVGAQPEAQVRAFLRQVAPSEGDRVQQNGAELLRDGRWAEAAAAFERALSTRPDPLARLGLAQALIRQGKGCEAEGHLSRFPAGPGYADAERLLPLARTLCRESDGQHNGSQENDRLFGQAIDRLRHGEYAAALYNLLSILRADRSYRDGEAKDVMLGVFALLGGENELTRSYRQQLASVIF